MHRHSAVSLRGIREANMLTQQQAGDMLGVTTAAREARDAWRALAGGEGMGEA